MFSAQSEKALSRVLSLARKYGLFLTLAHQTFSQLSSRLSGALQNTVAIAFRLGRSDAERAARRFGRFEETSIRHEVEDPQAVERTHPVYWGLSETFERWTQALEDLRPREAFVKLPGKTVKIRTRHVPESRCTPEQLHELMQQYAEALMTPARQIVALMDRAPRTRSVATSTRRVRVT